MREDFPACGRVTETVHVRAVDVMALESFVGWGEHLDFDTRFFQVCDRSAQPRDFGVFLKSWIDGAYDENFHCSCFAACCAWIS